MTTGPDRARLEVLLETVLDRREYVTALLERMDRRLEEFARNETWTVADVRARCR